jgi:glycosyltransferase involved in cell wall biosynthesis
MPVHNALPHLDAAVSSILRQSYRDIEFVIYDDASTDGSTERLRYWAQQDSRIRLFEGEQNLGPALSSNFVVEKATAGIIARMDADDISHPDRILQQLELLESDRCVGLVGTLCQIIDQSGRKLRDPEPWRVTRTSWFAPFPHGSIMFRREVFDHAGGYRGRCEYWEDQDLVLRMAAETEILVIPAALYKHRQSTASTRLASDQERVERAVDLMYRCMGRLSENRRYEDLLQAHSRAPAKLDPRVFVSLGSLTLWSGDKPRLFRRMLKRAMLRPDARTATNLAWAAWATTSPGSLRMFLRLLVRARNSGRRGRGRSDGPLRWELPDRRLVARRRATELFDVPALATEAAAGRASLPS